MGNGLLRVLRRSSSLRSSPSYGGAFLFIAVADLLQFFHYCCTLFEQQINGAFPEFFSMLKGGHCVTS